MAAANASNWPSPDAGRRGPSWWSGRRNTASVLRNSSSASLLDRLIAASATSACSGRLPTTCRATPACRLITAKPCPTTSWTSRAIRSRSSSARRRVSSWRTRCSASWASRTTVPIAHDGNSSPDSTASSNSVSVSSRSRSMTNSSRRATATRATPQATKDPPTGNLLATEYIATLIVSRIGPCGYSSTR
jgi:hypothetical protein